jgi:hypothetical protein
MQIVREPTTRRRFASGLRVIFDDDQGSTTAIRVALDGAVIEIVSTKGLLSEANRTLVCDILAEEGLDLFAAGTTALVQRLIGAGVAI